MILLLAGIGLLLLAGAASILLHNYYGWFARAERGVYALTATGHAAVENWRLPPALRGEESGLVT